MIDMIRFIISNNFKYFMFRKQRAWNWWQQYVHRSYWEIIFMKSLYVILNISHYNSCISPFFKYCLNNFFNETTKYALSYWHTIWLCFVIYKIYEMFIYLCLSISANEGLYYAIKKEHNEATRTKYWLLN